MAGRSFHSRSPSLRVDQRSTPVTSSIAPVTHGASNAASIWSSKKTPTIPAGTEASSSSPM